MSIRTEILERSVWLTGFWGFGTEDDGAYGFTKATDRDRFEIEADPFQLIAIYGASSEETPNHLRAQLLGLLEIELTQTDGHTRLSERGLESRLSRGHEAKWRFAYPVRRAWKIPNGLAVGHIFESYVPDKGQYIAAFGTYLSERDRQKGPSI